MKALAKHGDPRVGPRTEREEGKEGKVWLKHEGFKGFDTRK